MFGLWMFSLSKKTTKFGCCKGTMKSVNWSFVVVIETIQFNNLFKSPTDPFSSKKPVLA